jgi:uncharacterized protein (TIGR02145 family)
MKQENRCTYQIRVLSGFTQIPKICWILVCEILSPKMFKQILLLLGVWLSISLNAQVINSQSLESVERNKRNTSFNIEEIKVRWKKAALENCPGVPCITITVPGAPTGVVATAGNAFASVAFVAPANNGGSASTGYTVTSNPGGITVSGGSSPINVTGLTNNTAYTFTVVATNAVGNSVASTASSAVTPVASSACGATITVTDADGNTYNTVSIGTQCWTKQNLKVTKYSDGITPIDYDASGGPGGGPGGGQTWSGQYKGAYTVYGNELSSGTNATNYGLLYNWYAVAGIITSGGSPSKNICPIGWHVPTDAEWSTLTTYLGGDGVAGGKMKSTGTTYWDSPNTDATNSSDFSALPGGYRHQTDGSFNNIRSFALFWSASEASSNLAWLRWVTNASGGVTQHGVDKRRGMSVRCLKN